MASTNGYGALSSSTTNNRAGADEEQPLLGQPAISKASWRQKLSVNVSRDWADIVLLLCYVITGLLDSASISTWGSFVSMQTGPPSQYIISRGKPADSSFKETPSTSVLVWLHHTSQHGGSSQASHSSLSALGHSASVDSTAIFRRAGVGFSVRHSCYRQYSSSWQHQFSPGSQNRRTRSAGRS